MNLLKYLLLSLLTVSCLAQGAHRFDTVLVRGQGVAANIVPNATVFVYQTGSGDSVLQQLYSDIALTIPLDQPIVANVSGVFSYYVTPGCYDEIYSSPGKGNIEQPNVCLFNGNSVAGVSQIVAGTNITISPTNGLGTVTINATGGGGGSGYPPGGSLGELQSNASSTSFGPSGIFNSEPYRTSGTGENGIASAITAGITNPFIPNGSNSTEIPTGFSQNTNGFFPIPLNGVAGTTVHDYRLGGDFAVYSNPCNYLAQSTNSTDCTANTKTLYYNKPPVGTPTFPSYAVNDSYVYFMAYGVNTFAQGIQPAFKSNYQIDGTKFGYCFTSGQCNTGANVLSCYSFGDCVVGTDNIEQDVTGGCGDNADECKRIHKDVVIEANGEAVITCASGCTTGSTLISATTGPNVPQFGDLAYFFDPAAVIQSTTTGCTISTGAGNATPPSIVLSGSNCLPVSTMLLTTAGCTNSANYPVAACGNTVLTIATTGLPSGFSSSLSGLPSSGTVYAVDPTGNGGTVQWFNEATTYTISGGQITVNLTQPHLGPFYLSFGGAAGGLFFANANATRDAHTEVRQGVPILGVVGTTNPIVYLTDHSADTPVVNTGEAAVYQISTSTTSVVRASNIVTVVFGAGSTIPLGYPANYQGQSVVFTGVTPSDFNSTVCTNAQMLTASSFTCTQTGSNETASVQGTATAGNTSFGWAPAFQIKHAMNIATGKFDGTGMTLFPNNNFPFTTGQVLEGVHGAHMAISGDAGFEEIGQFQPFPANYNFIYGGSGKGVAYYGVPGPHLSGFQVDMANQIHNNGVTQYTGYLGYGANCGTNSATMCGTKQPPLNAYSAFGLYSATHIEQAGEVAWAAIPCNNHGCGAWNSAYDVLNMGSNGGYTAITHHPEGQELKFRFFSDPNGVQFGAIFGANYSGMSFSPGTNIGSKGAVQGFYGGPADPDFYLNTPSGNIHLQSNAADVMVVTPTAVLVTGIFDGRAPITKVTTSTFTFGTTYQSGYTINQNATTTTAVTGTLQTPVAGQKYCFGNGTSETGILTFSTPISGQFIDVAGVLSSSGGSVTSAGALGDYACVLGIDSTHWKLIDYVGTGTWTPH